MPSPVLNPEVKEQKEKSYHFSLIDETPDRHMGDDSDEEKMNHLQHFTYLLQPTSTPLSALAEEQWRKCR